MFVRFWEVISVLTNPGDTVLTSMSNSPSSIDADWPNETSADFEIECEIMRFLALNQISYKEHKVKYIRRKVSEGKKLKYSDSWSILKTIIFYKE